MGANESNTADEIARGFYNYSVIKSKIRKGDFKVVKKTGKSIVWRIFGKIEDKFGQEIPNVVVCLNCSNILKHANSRTSNLLKHKCIVKAKSDYYNNCKFEVNTKTKITFLNTITEWIIENCRSFKIVEDSGFIKTAAYLITLGANYGRNVDVQSMLPHPKTISGNITRVYDDYLKKFKTEITSVKDNGFGLLADLWENSNFKKAYVSLTIHYVKEEVLVSRLLGMRCMEAEKYTSDNINAEVCAILKEFDLDLDEKVIIVTDRRSIMVAAFQKYNHIFYIDHILNNIIQKSIDEISDLADLSKKCSDLAKYMKISGTNSCFERCTLKSFSTTRWSTMYSLFLSLEENWPNIIQTMEKRNEVNRIRNINPSHITAIIKVLKHFQEAFEKLEGENCATIHYVYMIIYHLQRKCVYDSADLEVVKQLKAKLKAYLNSEILSNLTIYHKIAVFLFPPANKLYKFNQSEKKEIKNECRRIMENYQQDMPEPVHQNKAQKELKIKELFFDFVQPPQNDMLLDRIAKEIAAYENLNITSFSNDFNVLEWWNSHKNEYPLLYKLSCQILATPVSANESINTDEGNASSCSFYDNSALKHKILRGELKISERGGKSKIWKVFGRIENLFGEEIPNIVACRKCINVYKFINSSTSNLIKHKCYIEAKSEHEKASKIELSTEEKLNFLNRFIGWIIGHCRSFKIVEDSGFVKTAEYLIYTGAKYGRNVDVKSMLPHINDISENITRVYDDYFERAKTEIATVKDNGFGLMADLWEDNYFKKAYVSLTIHYVKEGTLVSRLLGMRRMESDKCTSNKINAEVIKLLKEFDLELDDKSIIVTDQRSNMVAAFQGHNHIICVDNLLLNTIQKSMDDISVITDLTTMCIDLLKYMKASGLNSGLDKTLKSSSTTRWNTMYSLFVSVEENWPNIIQTIHKDNGVNIIHNNINIISNISAIIKVLEPFQEAFRKLGGENCATIHFVYMIVHHLQRKCVCDSSDLEVVKQLKGKLNAYLNTEILNNLTIYHKIAVFLFPPANKLYKFNLDEKTEIKNECRRIMESYQPEMPEPEHQNKAQMELEITELFFDYVQPPQNDKLLDRIAKEIVTYENLNVTSFTTDFNVLEWWDLHKNEFPLLYKLSCQILAIPASSKASEKLFSEARYLLSQKTSFKDCSIAEVMFLHSNVKNNELFQLLKEK